LKELTQRVLFAIPAAAIMLYFAWLGGLPFKILFGCITLVTVWESNQMLKQTQDGNLLWCSFLIAAFVWFFLELPAWFIFVICGLIVFLTITALFINRQNYTRQLFSTLFSGVYAPAGFLMIVNIRELGSETEGFWLVLSFFLMIWGNDVFAYFGGKNWGKTPLAPTISPNKTQEGFWFGFLGSAVGFLIPYSISGLYPLSIWAIIPSVLLIGFLGPIGDIAESRLKRFANVKDSSSLIPGHGGFFDRFDSMILTAPFIYFLNYLLI